MSRIGLSFLPFLFRFPAPTCSAGCDADLPAFVFDECNPIVNYSEIVRIFFEKSTATPMTDWTAATEYLSRIASGDMQVLTVIADKPAGASIVKDISNGRKITIGKDHTLNFTIDDVSDANYEAMRQMECGGEYIMRYETLGEKMFGGNEGIKTRVDVNNVLGRGREEIEVITGVLSWRSKFHPERTTSPIFGSGGSTVTYDTIISFAESATPATAAFVTGFSGSVDDEQQLEFTALAGPMTGEAITMQVRVGSGSPEVSFETYSDYLGKPFRYTDLAGVIHTGTFANGLVTL